MAKSYEFKSIPILAADVRHESFGTRRIETTTTRFDMHGVRDHEITLSVADRLQGVVLSILGFNLIFAVFGAMVALVVKANMDIEWAQFAARYGQWVVGPVVILGTITGISERISTNVKRALAARATEDRRKAGEQQVPVREHGGDLVLLCAPRLKIVLAEEWERFVTELR